MPISKLLKSLAFLFLFGFFSCAFLEGKLANASSDIVEFSVDDDDEILESDLKIEGPDWNETIAHKGGEDSVEDLGGSDQYDLDLRAPKRKAIKFPKRDKTPGLFKRITKAIHRWAF